MAARIAALVAAIAMVAAAIVVRGRIDHHTATARLTCSIELAAACNAIAGDGITVKIEAAGTTADRLIALDPDADLGMDGWLAAGPWPQIVNAARQARAAAPVFTTGVTVLASTPVVAVVETQRAALVRTKCGVAGGPVDWACVGNLPGTAWKTIGGSESLGQVKAGLSDPAVQGEGLAVLAGMSSGVFKGRDFSTDDDALRQLLRTLRTSRLQTGPDAVTTLLVSGGAELDLVFTTEAEAQTVLASAANRNGANVLYPAPVTTLNAELGTPISNPATKRLAELLRSGAAGGRALTASGWKPPVSGTGPADDPGEMAALRRVWQEQR